METAMVIVDPQMEQQPALARAIDFAKTRNQALHLHGFLNSGEGRDSHIANGVDWAQAMSESEQRLNYYAKKVSNKNIDVHYTVGLSDDSGLKINELSKEYHHQLIFKNDLQAA